MLWNGKITEIIFPPALLISPTGGQIGKLQKGMAIELFSMPNLSLNSLQPLYGLLRLATLPDLKNLESGMKGIIRSSSMIHSGVAGFWGRKEWKVAAGEFDTWKINCERYPDSMSYPGPVILENKTWYYAPVIDHWVVETRDFSGSRPSERKELIAVVPDLKRVTKSTIDVQRIQNQFQDAMESQRRGIPTIWSGSKAELVVSIIPRKSFRHAKGRICRQYDQQINVLGY